MDLYQTIDQDCKRAMKEKDALRVSVLRMVIAAVQFARIQKNLQSIGDADVLPIVQKQIKQRKESVEQFIKGNRADLADKEAAELKILEAYVPVQLTESELNEIIRAAIAEAGAVSKADTGKVMKAVMEKAKGRADGKTVSLAVSRLLPS